MISNLIIKGVALISSPLPQDWNERILLRLEDEVSTLTFENGQVVIMPGESPDPHTIIQLTKKKFLNIIDGSIDFMMVWRELAEPSPTDRRYILKGSGAKFFALLDRLIKCYKSNAEFKTLVDAYQTQI